MAQSTFPAFTNMIPTVEDMQLVVDSLREEDRLRTTKDGIFYAGIVNDENEYVSAGTYNNSIKIKPFTAYTRNGNRIEVSSTWDNLYPQGNAIIISEENLVRDNVPHWIPFIKTRADLNQEQSVYTEQIKLSTLGRGSILHGIKLRTNSTFRVAGGSSEQSVWVSIGTASEPDKFLPETLVSNDNSPTNISVMNLMYSLNDQNPTDIYVTFRSDNYTLNQMTSGSITINLCIANLEAFDNSDIGDQTEGGYNLTNYTTGTWAASTVYHIVARYTETPGDYRQLNYTDINGVSVQTISEPTRFTTGYQFFALRKSGAIIDTTTLDDVKLGEVITDEDRNVIAINVNGINEDGANLTDYLTLPTIRFKDSVNKYIKDEVSNQLSTKVTKTGDTMTGTLSMSSGNSVTFKGNKDYSVRSLGGSAQLNVYSSDGKGLLITGENDNLYYHNGTASYKLLDESDSVANADLSNLTATGTAVLDAKVSKSGDTMSGQLAFNMTGLNPIRFYVDNNSDLIGDIQAYYNNSSIAGLRLQYHTDTTRNQAYLYARDNNLDLHSIAIAVDNSNNVLTFAPACNNSNSILTSVAMSGSNSQNGYLKLGNGIMIQWGTRSAISTDQTKTVNFPQPFINTYYSFCDCALQTSTSGVTSGASIYSKSTSNVVLLQSTDIDQGGQWIAIGFY